MKQYWKKLEAYIQANNPALLGDLNPPANDSEILELEERLGVTLPADYIECLKVHNGQKGNADGLFSGLEFLSTRRIQSEWTIWKNLLDSGDFDGDRSVPASGIRADWWNPKWIPFTYNGGGDHLCLDLDPTSEGRTGQIIALWHDDNARQMESSSFAQWFSDFVDDFTN